MRKRMLLEDRLQHQLLGDRHFSSVGETVRWMGAVQGQDYKPGMWAIGMRLPGSTQETVETAVNEIQIVRSWTMRHTIHFVALEDVYWMTRLSRERMLASYLRQMERSTGLDAVALERGTAAFIGALQGKKRLSRPEMRQVLEAAGLDTSGQRLYYHLYYAAQCGIIFIGPMIGRQQSFGLVAEWMPGGMELTREKALEKLAHRYLRSHGPAMPQDFAWWAGLTLGDARLGFRLAKAEPDESMTGKEYWRVRESMPPADQPSSRIQLLHPLDEFVIGYKDRGALVAREDFRRLDAQQDGFFAPVLLDGKIIGRWKAREGGKEMRMRFSLLSSSTDSRSLLEQEAQHYSHFFGRQLGDMIIDYVMD